MLYVIYANEDANEVIPLTEPLNGYPSLKYTQWYTLTIGTAWLLW